MKKAKSKPKTEFHVHGPFEIPAQVGKKGSKIIGKDDVKNFWKSDEGLEKIAGHVGCYVFAVKAGRGSMPAYIGKTTKSFEKEALTNANRSKYNEYMSHYVARGKPVMFFLSYLRKPGPINEKHIDELETFLTQVAVARNEKLINAQKAKSPRWNISGVLRSSARRPSESATKFKELFGWSTRKKRKKEVE
jgi:hypothetical protein